MPAYLEEVGLPETNSALTKIAKELAGGFISSFPQFQNVFKIETYLS